MSPTYVLLTDSSSDLPKEYLEEHNVATVPLKYSIDDVEYNGDEQSSSDFYRLMREGKMPVTTQVNQAAFTEFFTDYLEQGLDVLYIAFSSGLSGTCASAQSSARSLAEAYPERKIYVVDSLCASLGQGLLVHKCIQQRDSGASIDEVRDFAEENKLKVAHSFTVEDLMHLHRGGRVSKASAIAGSLLGIKPVLHVDDAGHLIPLSKVRGRNNALNKVVEQMKEWVGDTPNDIVMISHGDDIEAAEHVADLIRKEFGINDILINYVGSVIGTHSGPGTIALFMMANHR